MKHCLNCYRMLPNNAKVCHYCGTEQAENKPLPGKKFDCCPQCMSFLYSEESGCQSCGYIHQSRKKYSGWIIAILAALLILFLLWQAGFLPWIPHGGKAVRFVIQKEDVTSVNPLELGKTITIQTTDDLVSPENPTQEFTVVPQSAKMLLEETMTNAKTTVTPQASDTPESVICANWQNRLKEGMHGSIITGGRSSKIRKNPSTGSELAGILRSGQEFVVQDEKPVCVEGYLWIKISLISDTLSGWTVEADQTGYWLKPLDKKPE